MTWSNRMLRLLFAASIALCVIACGDDDDPKPTPTMDGGDDDSGT